MLGVGGVGGVWVFDCLGVWVFGCLWVFVGVWVFGCSLPWAAAGREARDSSVGFGVHSGPWTD